MGEGLATLCSARLWQWDGKGWLWAILAPAPKNCSEVEGKSKDMAGRQWDLFRLLSLPSTGGFLPPGSFLVSKEAWLPVWQRTENVLFLYKCFIPRELLLWQFKAIRSSLIILFMDVPGATIDPHTTEED